MNRLETGGENIPTRFNQIESFFASNPTLLKHAMTRGGENNNRKLAFFGDAALGIIVSLDLYKRFPSLGEGSLTHMRAALVKSDTLAQVAREFGLDLQMQGGTKASNRTLSETVEALIGAADIAGGIENSEKLVRILLNDRIEKVNPAALQNPKGKLQRVLQSHGFTHSYSIVVGGDAATYFEVECLIPDLNIVTRGAGSTKQMAEKNAADNALSAVGALWVPKESTKKAKQTQSKPREWRYPTQSDTSYRKKFRQR